MIASLLIWIYAGALFYLYGRSVFWLFGRWLGRPAEEQPGLPLTMILGLGLATTVAAYLSLFMNLGAAAAGILLVIGLLLWVVARPQRVVFNWPSGRELWLTAIMVVIVLFCLENGTRPPANPDTNSYHAQMIRWIETYPAVPGLGNLSGRLAYNSDWLLLNAAFSFAFLGLRSFHVMAGLLFILATWFFLEGISTREPRNYSVVDWMGFLFVPAAAWILNTELSSPGTDLPVILLAWILLMLVLQEAAAKQPAPLRMLMLVLIPTYMVTLKLSTAPLLLIGTYGLVQAARRREPRVLAVLAAGIGMGLFVLIPWLARSVILSGYLVFPYPQVDVFHVDWKVPAAYADAVRNGIIGWARLPDRNWADAIRLPLQSWVPEWFAGQTLNQRVLLLLACLAPLGLLPRANRELAAPIATYVLAMLIWFISAPNLRFGYGVILGLAVFGVSVGLSGPRKVLANRAGGALPLLLVVYLVLMIGTNLGAATLSKRLLLPADYYPSRADPCPVGDLTVYCASVNKQCGYEIFPCVPAVQASVRPRGDRLQDGFYSTE